MKTLMSILTMICIGMAYAVPVKSMLGARLVEEVEEPASYTAADYIQDGLVAMWDGIENVGVERHDSHSMIWVDLVGENNAILTTAGSFGEQFLFCDGSNKAAYANAYADSDIGAIEVVMERESGMYVLCCTYAPSYGSGRGLVYYSNSAQNRYVSLFTCTSQTSGFSNGVLMQDGCLSLSVNFGDGGSIEPMLNGLVAPTRYVFGIVSTFGENQPMSIGGRNVYSTSHFIGRIYCIRLYNRTLLQEEIAHNYMIDKARFNLR